MTNWIFIIIHLVALFTVPWFLLVTIPLHMIFAKMNTGNVPDYIKYDGMKQCPFCAEYIREEANVCRYCQREVVS